MMEFFWHYFSSAIFGLTFYFFLIFRIHPVIYIFEIFKLFNNHFPDSADIDIFFTEFGPVLQQFETTMIN